MTVGPFVSQRQAVNRFLQSLIRLNPAVAGLNRLNGHNRSSGLRRIIFMHRWGPKAMSV